MIKFLSIIIFLGVALLTSGQSVKVQAIRQANPITKEVYIFPKVIVPTSAAATKKINNKLRTAMFGIPIEITDAHIFDSSWRTSYRMENISNLSFTVSEANSFFISLSISGEGCGAYCEAFTRRFTFNTKTGNLLTLDSLFNSKGLIAFFKVLNENKTQKLKAKLKEINESLRLVNVKKDPSADEQYAEMLSMYTECLEKKIDIAFVPGVEFLLKNSMVTVYTDRCSAHYNMAYDELWTFVYKTSLKKYEKVLKPYGVSLVNRKLR